MLESIASYYTAKVRRYGVTAQGVDWTSTMSQKLRFVQLLKVVADWKEPFSLHDLGCGYGALLDHLADRHCGAPVHYIGTDVSAEMIRLARRRWHARGRSNSPTFIVATATPPLADYSLASGIFNVKLDHAEPAWEQHVAATLRALSAASRKGFTVNFMAPEALEARPAAAACLYGPPPERWMAYCRDVLGCDVRLVCDYGLLEYTLLLRHPS